MPTEWVKIAERSYFPLSFSLNGSQNSRKYLKRYGRFNNQDKAMMYQDRFYWPKGEIEYIAKYQTDIYSLQGPKYLWKMASHCENQGHTFKKSIKKITSRKATSRSALAARLNSLFEEYRKFVVFMTLPWVLDNWFGEQLHTILTKRNLMDRVEIEKKLNQPLRLNEGELEQLSLLKIASGMKNEQDFSISTRRSIKKHLKRYSWIPMRWLKGSPLTEEEMKERLNHIFSKDVKKTYAALRAQPKKVKQEFDEISKKLAFTRQEKELVLLLKEYVYIRTYRSDLINESFLLIRGLLRQAARELRVSYDDLLYLSYGEIVESLRSKKAQLFNIAERKESWLLYRDGEDIVVLSGKQAADFAAGQGISDEVHATEDEVKGNTGYAGKVSGKVSIISNPNDIPKVKKGDILVAVMTFPSYIAAMERAAAFVTDEGGVLCHAAIVAREMKKPCVIGTQKATKVFRDGDTIEVDANQGVVRIVKRGSRWP